MEKSASYKRSAFNSFDVNTVFRIVRSFANKADDRKDEAQKVPLAPYRRGDKSLAELCGRFLRDLWDKDDFVINLELMTKELSKHSNFSLVFSRSILSLGIERRRLYDIINILEGLGLTYRVSKSAFMWRGVKAARRTLQKVFRVLLV